MRRQRVRDVEQPRTLPAGQVVGTVILTLLLAALLNADRLLEKARLQPYGRERDTWIEVWRPVAATSDALYLNRPRQWLHNATNDQPPAPDYVAMPGRSTQAAFEPPHDSLPPGRPIARPSPTNVPLPTPTPGVCQPAPDQPLNVWVGGDSLSALLGEALVERGYESGVMHGNVDARISTGLTRPDYFDWPREIARVVQEERPDVVVLMLGANDAQPIRSPGGDVYQPRSDGWRAEYARRVGQAMDTARGPGRLLVWVSLPPMRSDDLTAHVDEINAVVRAEAAKRRDILYVDSTTLLGDESGEYTPYVRDAGGDVEQIREQDGVHLTRAGAERLAEDVIQRIEHDVGITLESAE